MTVPRKATGGKIGRPRKSVTKRLSALQEKYVSLRIREPGLFLAEYARKLGVTRAAVSKWNKDSVIGTEPERREVRRIAGEIVSRMNKKDRARKNSINEEHDRMLRHINANIDSWVHKNWIGPIALPGDTQIFHTQSEYIEAMLERNFVPAEHIEEAFKRAERKHPKGKRK